VKKMMNKMELVREETAKRLPQYKYESSNGQGYWYNTETNQIIGII